MEKLIYTLFDATIAEPSALAADLGAAGVQRIRINLRDAAVAPATARAQQRGDRLPQAVVQCWVRAAHGPVRAAVDQCFAKRGSTFHAWLLSEAEVIANTAHPPLAGERTYGFAQIAFLTLPNGMAWSDWRRHWVEVHTAVAVETQSNFEYVQNLVVEPLTANAPPFVAIVEECFPPEAMTDPLVFFDAAGDRAKFERNLAAMMASCDKFIARGTIDVFATSQYVFG